MVSWNSKIYNFGSSLFFLFWGGVITIRYGLLAEIRWSVCMSKSHRSLCVSFSRTAAGLCIYRLFVWSNLNSLHISLWITFLTQSYLVLYSCANMLHSLIMWLRFRLYHHITYIFYIYLFSLWYDWFLWRCFVLLLGEILSLLLLLLLLLFKNTFMVCFHSFRLVIFSFFSFSFLTFFFLFLYSFY